MMHCTYLIHVPERFWHDRYPSWNGIFMEFQERHKQEHRREMEDLLGLPGLRARCLVVRSADETYRIQRVPVPWLYRLWWWMNRKSITEDERRRREEDDARILKELTARL